MEEAFHLPGLERVRTRPVVLGKERLAVAALSGDDMRCLLDRLRAAAGRVPAARRAAAVTAAARRFLDREDPLRRRAVDCLPSLTGFSRAMIEETLPLVFTPLCDPHALAAAAQHSGSTVRLLAIVAAGNIPGVALFKTALALAAGASSIVKTAAGEPLLCALFAQALAAIDPAVAAALAVAWWEGGSAACRASEDELLRGVDALVAYGSDEAVAALRARAPGTFIGFGHKLSLAIARLDPPADLRLLAEAAATDVALYDQLGCLSPQTLYAIGGGPAARRELVDRLADALQAASDRWPRGEVPEGHAIAIQRARDDYEWRELGGEAVAVRAGKEWTVLDDAHPALQPSPLYRTLFVRGLEALEALPRAVGEWLPRVECVGIAPWTDPDARSFVAALGVPRVAPLGQMQRPDLGWRQGGLEPMAGILTRKCP